MRDRPGGSKPGSSRPGDKPGATREQVERRERFQRAQRDSLRPPEDVTVLYGWHPVTAALQNPARRVRKLLATENAARRLADEKIPTSPPAEIVRPDAIAARLAPDALHIEAVWPKLLNHEQRFAAGLREHRPDAKRAGAEGAGRLQKMAATDIEALA